MSKIKKANQVKIPGEDGARGLSHPESRRTSAQLVRSRYGSEPLEAVEDANDELVDDAKKRGGRFHDYVHAARRESDTEDDGLANVTKASSDVQLAHLRKASPRSAAIYEESRASAGRGFAPTPVPVAGDDLVRQTERVLKCDKQLSRFEAMREAARRAA